MLSAALIPHQAGQAQAQLVMTYSNNLDEVLLPADITQVDGNQVLLGYEMQLPLGLSLTPNFGLLLEGGLADSGLSFDAYSFGLFGEYDLAQFGAARTYALGGLSYLDFSQSPDATLTSRSELQYALGFGAALPLTQNIGAFTNLRYTQIEGNEDNQTFDATTTGLQIGIEISF